MIAQGLAVPEAALLAALARMREPFEHRHIVDTLALAGFPYSVTAADLLIAREKRAGRIARARVRGWEPRG